MKKHSLLIALAAVCAAIFLGCTNAASTSEPTKSANDQLPAVSTVQPLNAIPDADFKTTGSLKLSLIALDSSGKSIVSKDVSISATAKVGTKTVNLTTGTVTEKAPTSSTNPMSVAIDLDSSGSMSSSDSSRLRVTASKNFVDLILKNNAKSQMAVCDFGAGKNSSFLYTRLLQDFTGEATLLYAGIDKCTDSGSTPMYNSLYEILESMNTNVSASSYQRAILVLTDGANNYYQHDLSDVSALSVKYGIPINCVALGYESSDLKSLATQTNGIYGYAKDAASLDAIFQNVAVGTTSGYVITALKFPADSIPTTSTVITLAVKSGGSTKTSTITLQP
jgi:hypothetical protein